MRSTLRAPASTLLPPRGAWLAVTPVRCLPSSSSCSSPPFSRRPRAAPRRRTRRACPTRAPPRRRATSCRPAPSGCPAPHRRRRVAIAFAWLWRLAGQEVRGSVFTQSCTHNYLGDVMAAGVGDTFGDAWMRQTMNPEEAGGWRRQADFLITALALRDAAERGDAPQVDLPDDAFGT